MPSYYTTIRTKAGIICGWAMCAQDGEDARQKAVSLSRNMPLAQSGEPYVILTRLIEAKYTFELVNPPPDLPPGLITKITDELTQLDNWHNWNWWKNWKNPYLP